MKSDCERCEKFRIVARYFRDKNGITEIRDFCNACRRKLTGKGWHKQS